MTSEYIHGFSKDEQQRLTLMQSILNERQVQVFDLQDVSRVLDVGSGLGQMTRTIARRLDAESCVIGVERSSAQLEEARRQAGLDDEEALVEFRQGDATDLPLSSSEFGSFDLVHTRFLLEHVPDPLVVVKQMVLAARDGGRIFAMDDDHELLRFFPECRELDELWTVYWQSYHQLGHDPLVGRRLPELMQLAGARVVDVGSLFYGAVRGQDVFDDVVDNLLGVIESSLEMLLEKELVSQRQIDAAIQAAERWRAGPSATIWYSLPYVVAIK